MHRTLSLLMLMSFFSAYGSARDFSFDVWYGDHQQFGNIGHTQKWVNILGNVQPSENIKSLSWSVNGGEEKHLSFREDFHRIARDGDFNVEIDRHALKSGRNIVQITARGSDGATATKEVVVDYQSHRKKWPLPYTIKWAEIDNIQDVAQVVDGNWKLTEHGIRSVERYYDRIIAFGDDSWRDYEVTTTVTVHALTAPHTDSNKTGVTHAALAVRWPGHRADGTQPSVPWFPLGATAEFSMNGDLRGCHWQIFDGKDDQRIEADRRRNLEFEKPYWMKHRVETLVDGRSRYRVKLWPVGEDEPNDWDLERFEAIEVDILRGSANLIAHHSDVTFGDIKVVPVGTQNQPSYPPSDLISGLTIDSERISFGDGDNWPITWADDGNQYTVYVDGKGFGGGSGKGSMALARIVGDPPDFSGENIDSPTAHKLGDIEGGRKASGLLMADGFLYMWVRNLTKNGTGSSLAWSGDRAATWTWADWNFPEIGYPTWLNAGQNYAAAQDDFAYVYFPETPSAYQTSDHIMLARVPKSEIRSEKSYRFFAGMDDRGKSQWSASFKERRAVFTDPGHCYRPEVVFNPGIGKYILLTATSGSPRWCGTDVKYLGVFEAPTPWGPWHTVRQIEGWGGEENRFQPRMPSRWISRDGASFYLLYSCFPEGPYQFNIQKCSLQLNKQ